MGGITGAGHFTNFESIDLELNKINKESFKNMNIDQASDLMDRVNVLINSLQELRTSEKASSGLYEKFKNKVTSKFQKYDK